MLEKRQCVICGTEYQPKRYNQKTCSPECRRTYNNQQRRMNYKLNKYNEKEYNKEHNEQRKKYQKDYYRKNKTRIKEYSTKYREENREKVNTYAREYHKKNREAIIKNREKKKLDNIDYLFAEYMEYLEEEFPQ